jgi:hypothetical protein
VDGTVYNAQVHMMVAAALTMELGADKAREVLDIHENILNGQAMGTFDAYRQMDIINNDIGIGIGELVTSEFINVPKEDPRIAERVQQLVALAIETKDAVWFKPSTPCTRQC